MCPLLLTQLACRQNAPARAAPRCPPWLLPRQVLVHRNECFDLGTIGWFLEGKHLDLAGFRYFVFLNASVRGPFLPAYWPVRGWGRGRVRA